MSQDVEIASGDGALHQAALASRVKVIGRYNPSEEVALSGLWESIDANIEDHLNVSDPKYFETLRKERSTWVTSPEEEGYQEGVRQQAGLYLTELLRRMSAARQLGQPAVELLVPFFGLRTNTDCY